MAPVRLRLRFRVGLLLVALVTVLLPVIYLGLIAAAGYGVYYHLVNHTWLLEGRGASILRFIAYLGPAVVGAVLVFFMFKPLLARPAHWQSGLVIGPADAPLLFAFVEQIRAALRAPAPREIRLDTDVNASASFRRGATSLFRRADLTLTIGLPLLAGMELRQLGGVLAHELGHFAQGSSMRLTYLIRAVNRWLGRVAYERDSWDEWLARTAAETDLRIGVVLHIARFTVWLTRRALAGLALVGHLIGTFMLRQMEYDADRYEAALVGSAVFESTALRMRVLVAARGQAMAASSHAWRDGRLCEDLGALTAAMAARMPAQVRANVEAGDLSRERKLLFDTHPPDRERIASARAENAPGILHLDGPAAVLLGEGSPLPRRVSEAFYREENGITARPDQLRPLVEFLERHDGQISEVEAGARYFGDLFDLFHPLSARPVDRPPSSLAVGVESLRDARDVALRLRPPAPDAGPEDEGEAKDATARGDGDRSNGAPTAERLAAARTAARERFTATLDLLALPEVRQWLGAEVTSRIDAELGRLLPALQVLVAEAQTLQSIAAAHDEAVDLFADWSRAREEEGARIGNQITERLSSMHVQVHKLEQRLAAAPYPFEHARGGVSIAGYVRQGLPEVDGLGPEVQERTGIVLRRLQGLHERALGRLAVHAERIEDAADRASYPGPTKRPRKTDRAAVIVRGRSDHPARQARA